MDWSQLFVDFCDVFNQLFGLILTAPIYCNGYIKEQVMKLYISLNLFQQRNERIYILSGLRASKFKANFPNENSVIVLTFMEFQTRRPCESF